MTPRHINLMLWTTSTLLMSAAGVVLIGSVLVPMQASQPTASSPIASTAPGSDLAQDILDADQLAWSRPLQSLTTDTTAPAEPVGSSSDGGLHLRLVGTVGHSLALLATPEGGVVVRGVGESLGGAEVIAVQPLRVDLRYNGKVVTLTKPPPPASDG